MFAVTWLYSGIFRLQKKQHKQNKKSSSYIVVLLLTHLCVTFVPTDGVERNMSSLK